MPTIPPLDLNRQPAPGSSWLYEAFVVYDAADEASRESVDRISEQLIENGVRTMKNLNEPGSLRSGYALAMSTTAEAIVSTGITVVLVTRDLLAKAKGVLGGPSYKGSYKG